MSTRNLRTLEDCIAAISELDDYQEYLKTKALDMNQRNIKNTHTSVDDYDVVVRKELKDFIGGPTSINPRAGTGVPPNFGYDIRTFGYGIGVDLVTGTDLLPPLIIPWASCTLLNVYAKCKVAPTGATAIADINLAGVSILGATKVVIPIGSTSPITPLSVFATINFVEDQVLTFDMDQVGSIVKGQTFVVTLKFRIDQP